MSVSEIDRGRIWGGVWMLCKVSRRHRGRMAQIRAGLVSTSSLLAFALLAEGRSEAQTVAQAEDPTRLRQIDVSTPGPQPAARPARPSPQPKRLATPRPGPAAPTPSVSASAGSPTLNLTTPASSGSRLNLSRLQTRASVEVTTAE